MNFLKLLEDMKRSHRKTKSVCGKVQSNVVPNNYFDKHSALVHQLKQQHFMMLNFSKLRQNDESQGDKPIHTFRKSPYAEHRRSLSVMEKRRNWTTSSAKRVNNEDEKLDLKKSKFGPEYRQVLNKLMEPKLPDNSVFKGDPSYEYAQKAQKLMIVRKMDIIKNSFPLRHLRRKTTLNRIRDMLCIMGEHEKHKFSVLEVDYSKNIV